MRPGYLLSLAFLIGFLGFLVGLTMWTALPTHAQGQVQVTAADPAMAEQGIVNLNVRVTGKGFKNGAKAKWFVTGTTDPGGVTVNSTTFVSSTELTANITVEDAATVGNFDIQVLNSDGRGGKGTELFAVTPKGQTSCGTDITNLSISIYKHTDATNTTTYNMWPDQTNSDGSPVPYVTNQKAKVEARFQISNCSYDLTLNLSTSRRYFTWKFPGGSPLGSSVDTRGFNIDRVGNVPVTDGGPTFLNWCSTATDNYGGCGVDDSGAFFVRKAFGSAIVASGNQHYAHRFNYSPFDNINAVAGGTAYVRVYHTDTNTWTIMPDQVQPPPGVTGTDGEWSVLLNKGTTPPTILSYQKMPFKVVVTKF